MHKTHVLLSVLLIISCKDANITNFDRDTSSFNAQQTDPLKSILLGVGFDSTSIIDIGNSFIVEKDMIFKKDVLEFYLQKKKQRQYRFTVDTSKIQEIIINTQDLNDKGSWERNFIYAVDHWNNVSNSKVSFVIDNNAPNPKIVINATELENLRWKGGKSEVPDSVGNPGKSITIEYDQKLDSKYENTNPRLNERTAIAVHELGHTIGLAHTDSPVTSQVQIRCTPFEDKRSIMN